jgi:tetrahydromethanopterin S-methyltransferase subunit F
MKHRNYRNPWLAATAGVMVAVGIYGIAFGAVFPGVLLMLAGAIWLVRYWRAAR